MERRHRQHKGKAVWGAGAGVALILAAGALASCGKLTTTGQSASYLVITTLQGASGKTPGSFSSVVSSDVVSIVNSVPTIFADPGQVTFQLALKDPGPSTSPNAPTTNNFITVDRYHVEYIRTDGRNVQGLDVPYAFDGGVTGTITNTLTIGFTLVRTQAKLEAPLAALAGGSGGGIVISTIAKVTFYGHDQTGREVSVTGNIEVDFSDFGG